MDELTETELATKAYEEQRAALVISQEEIKAMREHRLSLLQTGTPEDVLSLDDEIRLESVKIEISTARIAPLKNYLARAREEREKWTGVDMPTAAELDRLLAIVSAAHPSLALEKKQGRFDIALRNHRDEFKRAFYAVGRMGRLSEPDADRYVSSVFDDANSILKTRRLQEIEGDAFHAAAPRRGRRRVASDGPRYGAKFRNRHCAPQSGMARSPRMARSARRQG